MRLNQIFSNLYFHRDDLQTKASAMSESCPGYHFQDGSGSPGPDHLFGTLLTSDSNRSLSIPSCSDPPRDEPRKLHPGDGSTRRARAGRLVLKREPQWGLGSAWEQPGVSFSCAAPSKDSTTFNLRKTTLTRKTYVSSKLFCHHLSALCKSF